MSDSGDRGNSGARRGAPSWRLTLRDWLAVSPQLVNSRANDTFGVNADKALRPRIEPGLADRKFFGLVRIDGARS